MYIYLYIYTYIYIYMYIYVDVCIRDIDKGIIKQYVKKNTS